MKACSNFKKQSNSVKSFRLYYENHTSKEIYFFHPFEIAAIPSSSSNTPLITINVVTTINEKLTHATFPQWRAQFEELLIDYDLIEFCQWYTSNDEKNYADHIQRREFPLDLPR